MRTESTANPALLDAKEFLTTLQPSLSRGSLQEALEFVQQRWTCPQLLELLEHPSADVRKVAALSLSLVGDRAAIKPLAIALYDRDVMVPQMAEHALWAIWFRLGKPRAVGLVKCGNTHMHHGNYECAIEKFTQAIEEDPDFAEAYNQRGLACYLNECFLESIADCRAALDRMPQHFGARAGMGHCHAHLRQWHEARKCYRLALAMHPRMEGIEASLKQIDKLLRENPGL